MQMDADGQHKPEYIEAMLKELEAGSDIVIGNPLFDREKAQDAADAGQLSSAGPSGLTTAAPFGDPTSGMRMFNRTMVEEFAQNLSGPEPDTISYPNQNGATVKGKCRWKWANAWRARAT